jgi:hypothetical protein
MKGRPAVWLRKKAKRGFRGYLIATVAFYGPTADFATKIVASIVPGEGCDPDPLDRWFSQDTDVRTDPEIGEQVIAFLTAHDARPIVVTDGIIGCPHEEEASIIPMAPLVRSAHTGPTETAGLVSVFTEASDDL